MNVCFADHTRGVADSRSSGGVPEEAVDGLTAPYGQTAHQLDPAWSEQAPSCVFAAGLKAERERRQLELAAEHAEALAGRRKRKKGNPPPPKAPRRTDPPKRTGPIDPDELPF